MEFTIYISHNLKSYRIKVDLFYESNQVQRFKVYGKRGVLVLQNNYPLLIATKKQKTKVSWKILEGKIYDINILEQIITELKYKFFK